MRRSIDHKHAAVEHWTANLCGANVSSGDDLSTAVRHTHTSGTPVTAVLAKRIRALGDPAVVDRVGRIGGWYVVARGVASSR